MIERILGPLPAWAKDAHPVLRYELGARPRLSVLSALGALAGIALLGIIGFLTATQALTTPLSLNLTESANRLLYAPALILQLLCSVLSLTLTTGAVGDAIRRQQWDALRATASGADLLVRARWAAVFYRLRLLLVGITLIRLVLIAGILWDLTSFQGEYLDLLISGITPPLVLPITPQLDLGLAAAILLLACMLTAGVLLPFTSVAFDAAFGLLLSSYVRPRIYSALLTLLVIVVRVAFAALLGYWFYAFVNATFDVQDGSGWPLMFGFGAFVDWGLRYLHLSAFGEIWAIVAFGILLGPALLAYALLQAALAHLLLRWAAWRAQASG